MHYIHSKGIIHIDLKPGNIFIGDNNELIIGDFGLALERQINGDKLAGTYKYTAPELWLEIPPPYSEESDIFALGCILYEIYTLKMAFNGKDTNEIRYEILNKKEFPFERVSDERNDLIEELIKKMLEKEPRSRITMREIEEKIEELSQQLPHSFSTSFGNFANRNRYESLTVNFYLGGGYIGGKSLEDISKMNEKEFTEFWNDDDFLHVSIIFVL